MQHVSIHSRYASLRPTAASCIVFISNAVYHVTFFKQFPPFLVGTSQTFELFLWYLVVVVMQNRIVLKEKSHTVEKLLVVNAQFQEVNEYEHVSL